MYNLTKDSFNIEYLETMNLEKQVDIVSKYTGSKAAAKAYLKKHKISCVKENKDV
jgi:hypothetical protein